MPTHDTAPHPLKRRTLVSCACGCGTQFEATPFRIAHTKSGQLFLDRAHMQAYRVGKGSPSWRGGSGYAYGRGWTAARKAVRARDKVCQECGKTPEQNGKALHVHHVVPYRVCRQHELSNLIALCSSCHQRHSVHELATIEVIQPQRLCVVCDTPFKATSSSANTCSEPCRVIRRREVWRNLYYKHKSPSRLADSIAKNT